jgi:gamma-glutamyltranspeptidase/glutathione hydrolase
MSVGIVAASHPLAAEAGAEMLRAGGNAVDAAAAVQFALNVAEPLASGIGGGAFELIQLASGETFVLDSRERAPAAATADQFLGRDGLPLDEDMRCASGLAVGVPGTLMGQAVALSHWGSLPLARTLQPAIALTEEGVPVSVFMARRLEQHRAKLRLDPASAELYLPDGEPLRAGDRLVQADLGRAFRLIAEGGPDAFYRGEIGPALVAAVRARGGRLTPADLASYQAERREPLSGSYRGYKVATMPPPGAGFALLQALRLLEPFDLAGLGQLSTARAHREVQVMRLALADRAAFLADPHVASVPVSDLLDEEYLTERCRLIVDGPLAGEPPVGEPGREGGETTHFTVLDRWGNLVSCTSTLEDFFGCGITVPGYGFLLNNEMTDFAAEPGHANEIRPFARPASSMLPTLVLRGEEPLLALGSPGGPTIVTAVLQVLLRVIDDRMPLQAAIDAPRFFASRYPRVTWEEGVPEETLAGLRELGHRPASRPTTIGSVQAVMFEPGGPVGAADPRREPAVVIV